MSLKLKKNCYDITKKSFLTWLSQTKLIYVITEFLNPWLPRSHKIHSNQYSL